MVADVVERTIETAIKLARQARKQCSRQERLRLKRARDRVLHFLACEGGATGVVTWVSHLSELAAELGLERETLYRALAGLEAEGLLQPSIGRVRHEFGASFLFMNINNATIRQSAFEPTILL
jgi:DNA-binding MarR family transcriptional regulator